MGKERNISFYKGSKRARSCLISNCQEMKWLIMTVKIHVWKIWQSPLCVCFKPTFIHEINQMIIKCLNANLLPKTCIRAIKLHWDHYNFYQRSIKCVWSYYLYEDQNAELQTFEPCEYLFWPQHVLYWLCFINACLIDYNNGRIQQLGTNVIWLQQS